MTIKTTFSRILLAGVATAALSACGADDIASPGSGGNITINNPTPAPTPTPTPTPTGVTPADDCPTISNPTQLADRGTLTGPTGVWRVCELPAAITANTALPKVPGLLYSLGGRTDVGSDLGISGGTGVTLTIDPGVIVFGDTGVSWLAVNRGNKLNAIGTATSPIVFTSRANVVGLNSDSSSSQWGGVVLLGRGLITDCTQGGTAGSTTTPCQRDTEGASTPAIYGGADNSDNSGELKYVQIRYSGFVLGANSELQGLTPSGVGTGTKMEYIQIHNSSDDGIEFFGGAPRMKHVVITGAEDDSLDVDVGTKALLQYVIAVQRSTGDSLIEGDTDNVNDIDNPRTNLRLANFTFLGNATSGNGAGIMMRGGMDANLMNGVIVDTNEPCLQLRNAKTIAAADPTDDNVGPPIFNSVVMECGGSGAFASHSSVTAAQTQTIFEAGSNNDAAFTASLTSLVINGANETAVTAFDPSTVDAFFDATTYVGAVKDASDTWHQGWTCNSSFADFGGSGTACTSLPTT